MEITYDKILKQYILETDTFSMLLGSEKLSDEAVADVYSKVDSIVENYNRNKKKIFQMVYYSVRDFDRSRSLRNIEDLLGKPQYDPMCSCVVCYGHIADHMVTVYLKDEEFDKPYSVCLCDKYTCMITPAKWQTAEASQEISSQHSYGEFRQVIVPCIKQASLITYIQTKNYTKHSTYHKST